MYVQLVSHLWDEVQMSINCVGLGIWSEWQCCVAYRVDHGVHCGKTADCTLVITLTFEMSAGDVAYWMKRLS